MEWIAADTLRMMQERNGADALQECASQQSQRESSSVECAVPQQQLHSSSQGCNSVKVDDQPPQQALSHVVEEVVRTMELHLMSARRQQNLLLLHCSEHNVLVPCCLQ